MFGQLYGTEAILSSQYFPTKTICITVPKVSKCSPTTLSSLLFPLLIGISPARCHPPVIIQNDWLNLVLNFKPTLFQVSLGITSNFLLVKLHFFLLKSHASPFLVPIHPAFYSWILREELFSLILSTKLPNCQGTVKGTGWSLYSILSHAGPAN